MIALWMVLATLVAFVLALAARAVEPALRSWRMPGRGAWGLAIALALALPVGAALAPRGGAPARAARGSSAARVARLPAFVVRAGRSGAAGRATLRAVARPLAVGWGLASFGALLLLVRATTRLRAARRGWTDQTVAGTAVLLSDDVGPAVVGVRRPAIVLPAWTLSLDDALLALVVRHEAEHVRAHDPALLALGAAALVAMPWNPAIWWMLRRLRLAAELDCDARVLAATRDASRYGLLLLTVAQRRATVGWTLSGAPALVESSSDLSRRIVAMRTRRSPHRIRSSAAAVVVTSAAVVAAIAACAASRDVMGPKTSAGSPPDVLKLPAREILATDSVPAMLPSGDGVTLRTGQVPASLAAKVATVVDASAHPASSVPAPSTTPRAMTPTRVDGPYLEFQVERPVTQAPGSPGPRYPDALRDAKIEGTVMAQFVVDTTGHVLPGSFRVLKAPADTEFVVSVRSALPNMRFEPALVGGRKVRQFVQQPFQFQLSK